MGSHDPFGHLKHKLWPKEGLKVNCQFDSWPLKIRNRPNFLVCKWCATYHWKALDEGYNFSLKLISIGGLHTKLWAPKITEVPTLGISGFPFGSLGTKWHLGDGPVAKHIIYYKGGRWWLPPNPGHGESCEFVFAYGSSKHQNHSIYALTNLLFGLCRSMWMINYLSFFLLPSRNSNTPLYP
jgi:hypothetical protein